MRCRNRAWYCFRAWYFSRATAWRCRDINSRTPYPDAKLTRVKSTNSQTIHVIRRIPTVRAKRSFAPTDRATRNAFTFPCHGVLLHEVEKRFIRDRRRVGLHGRWIEQRDARCTGCPNFRASPKRRGRRNLRNIRLVESTISNSPHNRSRDQWRPPSSPENYSLDEAMPKLSSTILFFALIFWSIYQTRSLP